MAYGWENQYPEAWNKPWTPEERKRYEGIMSNSGRFLGRRFGDPVVRQAMVDETCSIIQKNESASSEEIRDIVESSLPPLG